MNEVRVELKLRWFCPGCRRQHGLRGDPALEATYINGPLEKVVKCQKCERKYSLKPARGAR